MLSYYLGAASKEDSRHERNQWELRLRRCAIRHHGPAIEPPELSLLTVSQATRCRVPQPNSGEDRQCSLAKGTGSDQVLRQRKWLPAGVLPRMRNPGGEPTGAELEEGLDVSACIK